MLHKLKMNCNKHNLSILNYQFPFQLKFKVVFQFLWRSLILAESAQSAQFYYLKDYLN